MKTTVSIVTSESVRPWQVVVVPFPYTERLAEKRRPAVVVSSERLHREGYLWIAMITGAGKTKRAGDVPIRDLEAAGLPGASLVRAAKLATIEPDRIVRRIGRLADTEQAAVRKALASFLAK
jgi:mRNA interferase MazF